jgi:hypothetical protein
VKTPDVAADAIDGSKVAKNSLGGAQIDESSLGLGSEGWHELSEADFKVHGTCRWRQYSDARFNTVAYLRDRSGFVHLKGLAQSVDVGPSGCGISEPDGIIFTLPSGYRPAKQNLFAVLANNVPTRLDVLIDGDVRIYSPPASFGDTGAFLQLDGVSFRCAPSGQSGCP